jgi:hypothetical protein
MSGCFVPFHCGLGARQLAPKTAASPMNADSGRVSRAAADLRDLGRIQALPGDERKQLLVLGAKPRESSGGRVEPVIGRRPRNLILRAQARGEAIAPSHGPPLVREDTPGGPVEPKERAIAFGHVLEPPPGDEKGLGYDVGGVLGAHTPERVAEDAVVIRLVENLETIAPRAPIGQPGRRCH